MFELSPITLGITSFILGLGIFILTRISLGAVTRTNPILHKSAQVPFSMGLAAHDCAVILVEPGGRVMYSNQRAGEWFDLQDEEMDLESMARGTDPSEAFLSLCAQEGQTRFSLNGRLVQGVSYSIPNYPDGGMVVSLQRLQFAVDSSRQESTDPAEGIDPGGSSRAYFEVFTELSQAMASNLDLATTIKTILESIERLIPADYAEVNIWDEKEQHLVPHRLLGLPGSERKIEQTDDRYTSETGYSGFLIRHRTPLYIPNLEDPQEAPPETNPQKYPLQSYLGVPLLIAGDLIGTLELGSTSTHAFTPDDLNLLKLLAGQAAIALHNALIYQEEQRRAKELAGLAQLAKASSALREEQDLYPRLVEALDPLLEVEVLGFLIFDESRQLLKARAPFLGLPIEYVDIYQVPILPDSAAEGVWSAQEIIYASSAPEDPRLQALGLEHHAMASGMRATVLVPLNASERNLGYLLAANKRDGTPFDQEDMRLLTIVAGHAALIIENATLFRQSERRAQRAESLRRIASLASSIATKDEILKWSLQELARLVGADAAAIFLLEESSGDLQVHWDSLLGVSQQTGRQLSRLSVPEGQFNLTVTGSQQTFITRDAEQDKRILPFYKPLVEQLNIRSAIDIPLVVRDHGIGEMMFGSHTANFFGHNDLQTLTTAAGQLAGAIERSILAAQTDENLNQRVRQLTALTRISRELNATSDLEHLLKRVFAEVIRATSADCGTILLLDPPASNGHTPEMALQVGDDLDISLHFLERAVLESEHPTIIEDFEQVDRSQYSSATDDTFPLQPPHPDTRSALLVPIRYQERTAGLIYLHANEPGRFGPAAMDIAQALSVQAASALGNSLRYLEQVQQSTRLERRVEALEGLLKATQTLRANQPLAQSLKTMAQSLQESTHFQIVLISVYDAEQDRLQRIAAAGLSIRDTTALRSKSQLWSSVKELLREDFKIGEAYFIPHEKMPVVPPDVHIYVPMPLENKRTDGHTWHPEDILVIPMFDPSEQLLGLISVDDPRDGLRPDRTTIDSLQLFARQIGLIIQSHQKSSRSDIDGYQIPEGFLGSKPTAPIADNEFITAYGDLEHQPLSIQRKQSITRMRACLNIAKRINHHGERSEVLSSLANELLKQMDWEFVLVAEAHPSGLQLTNCIGPIPPGANPGVLLGQRNPLQHSLLHSEMILVPDLHESLYWQKAPLIQVLQAQSLICLPVSSNHRPEVAILGISRSAQRPFSSEDKDAFDLLARQAGIALQNAKSLAEAKLRLHEVNHLLSFSRQVSSLEPGSVLQALVNSARQIVPEADAAAVVIWDAEKEGLVPKAASGYADVQRLNEIIYPLDGSLPGITLRDNKPLRIDEVNFSEQYRLLPESLMRYRDATAGKLPVSSLLVPITSSKAAHPDGDSASTHGVLILDSYKTAAAFTPDDQSMITSLASQAALTLENVRLYQASEQRAGQIQAMTSIAGMIASSLESDQLIASLLEQMHTVIQYDTGTLWLREANHLTVRAAYGFEDTEERVGLTVALDDSRLFNEMVSTGQAIYVNDVRQDPRFSALFDYPHLSWLGIPLIAKGEMIGVIALEKSEANYYTHQDIQLVSAFASQAAIALENANLYRESLRRAQQLDRRAQRLGLLNRLSTALSAALEQDEIFRITIEELGRAVNCSAISAVAFEYPEGGSPDREDRQKSPQPILMAEQPYKGLELPHSLPQTPLFDRLRQTLGVFSTEKALEESELAPLNDFFSGRETQSLLIVPMSTGADLHSLLLIHNNKPYHYSTEEFELVRTVSNQAAIAVENARLFEETRRLTEELEQRVEERTSQLAEEHRRIATLLRIITELSASLDLEQVLTRTLKVLNQVIDAEQIFCLIWHPREAKLRQAASVFRQRADPEDHAAFKPYRGFAGEVILNRKPRLIADVLEDPNWGEYQDIESSQRSAAGVPLMVGEELLGVLLLFHSRPGHFSPDQLDLIQATGNQIAVTINNAELYNLIRDQAEDLGNMLRSQQIETSRSRAILESVAEGVLVTDAENKITLFNASAEKILGLDRQQILGRSLEHFTGLFGGAARSWMATIQEWSSDLIGYNSGKTYAEKINLEDGRVVSIQLAPVLIRDEFLGTVSIFHDITHQVEVDRLKTEFVATVSHELRTPMTSIKGYVDLLLMGATGELSEQQQHFLEIVKENTQRLAILVNDLLDISRIEANRVKLALQPLDLLPLAENVIADLLERSKKENKTLEFNLEAASDLPRVIGDPERVRQILTSLLDNAYHYTPGSGQISLHARQLGDEVQVDIQDSGIGVPVEEQKHVFERFFRGENPLVLEISGTGLGLSIVKHLVEMHAGRIWLESTGRPGEGSTFSFTLPVYEPKD